MSPAALLAIYCVLIVAASLVGGWVPLAVRLTHRRMEVALSFVSGVMLGIAVMDLLPHAILERAAAGSETAAGADAHGHQHDVAVSAIGEAVLMPVALWLLAGFLVMFFLERVFSFHHHDVPEADGDASGSHHHEHVITWTGAAIGLTVHTLVAGIALAASVESAGAGAGAVKLAGLGTFLLIVLHKPFDALTIGTLMAAGRHSRRNRHLVNAIFSLAVPVGVLLFHLGPTGSVASAHTFVSTALAFSAGAFLCISLSDLLPELQFHRHDRAMLSIALLLGLGVAWLVAMME